MKAVGQKYWVLYGALALTVIFPWLSLYRKQGSSDCLKCQIVPEEGNVPQRSPDHELLRFREDTREHRANDRPGKNESTQCHHIKPGDLAFLQPYLRKNEWYDDDWSKTKRNLLNLDTSHCPTQKVTSELPPHVFGVGLSKTGTTSLHDALHALGYNDMEGQPDFWERVVDSDETLMYWNISGGPDESRFIKDIRNYFLLKAADVKKRTRDWSKEPKISATDFPVSLFYDEMLMAFPDALFVLTTRDIISWYKSASRQMSQPAHAPYNIRNRITAYSEGKVHPHMFPKKFIQHYKAVLRSIPCCQLLVMDILRGEGWKKLCQFLQLKVPDEDFPSRRVSKVVFAGVDTKNELKKQLKEQNKSAAEIREFLLHRGFDV